MRRRISLSALLLLGTATLATTQPPMPAGPTPPPPIIQRFREMVKIGHADAHEANERAWAGAYAKTKLPYYSIALTSMTGPNDAWWMSAWQSFKQFDETNAALAKNKEFQAANNQYSAKDAEYVSDGIGSLWALRQDLSYRDTVDWSTMHAYQMIAIRARPGHDGDFKQIALKIRATHQAAATGAHWAMYQGMMGVPDGTYLVIIPLKSVADIDAGMKEDAQFAKALGEVGAKELDKLSSDGIISVETNLFAVSAKMSYVSEDWHAADADFWKGGASSVMQAGSPMGSKKAAPKP
jgi:hypothetical protein